MSFILNMFVQYFREYKHIIDIHASWSMIVRTVHQGRCDTMLLQVSALLVRNTHKPTRKGRPFAIRVTELLFVCSEVCINSIYNFICVGSTLHGI